MKRFLDLPIRLKLLWLIVFATGVALVLSMLVIVIYDSFEYTNQRIRELQTQAAVFGVINTAALTFNDPQSAGEYLASLKFRPQVRAVALYKASGKLFTSYVKDGKPFAFPPVKGTGYQIHDDYIDLYHSIYQNNELLGTIYMRASLDRLSRTIHIVGLLFVVMLLALALSLWVSNKLQSIISVPLLEIGAVADAIVTKENYSLRAKKYNADEIGLLAEAFNKMLLRIEERDASLLTANQSLQKEVDARKRAQDSLKNKIQELARSNAELEQFAYVSSHDLQEPLRMIASYTQLIEKRYATQFDEKGHTFLSYVVEGAKRMQVLIDDLLMFSRVGTRGKTLEPVPVQRPLEIALRNLDHAIKQSGASVTIPEALPTVIGDTTQLTQLFQNLIGNAIKFNGEKSARVEIGVTKLNEFWQFNVKDYGIGIDREHFDRIFVIFQRLHGRTEYPGSGIGLAICKKIVERHGGRIWLESDMGIGTTFHFTLMGTE
jgi:signal transduction histidine kinase